MTADARSRLRGRLRAAFSDEEREGLMLAAKVRSYGLTFILVWQVFDNPNTGLAYFYDLSAIALFVLLGLLQYLCVRQRIAQPWLSYLFVLLDCTLITVFVTTINPFGPQDVSPALALRGSKFVWYFLFLMQAAFSFRPNLVLWCGLCIAATRTAGMLWVATRPGVFTNVDLTDHSLDNLLRVYLEPNFVFLGSWFMEIVAALLVAAGLAVVVARSRRFVENRSLAERARANLARYFSPNVVDQLAQAEESVRAARDQDVAVLFADIMGFTRLCESEPADKVVELLRDYHRLLAQAVFDHEGTLDKYIGDGLMATFGTPQSGPRDASNALRCAVAMVEAVDGWNTERWNRDKAPVRVGIGLHFGPAILGDIGDERRLEFAVIGDTVNIASRIEHMTRDLGTPLVISQDLVEAVRREADGAEDLLQRFADTGLRDVRGRSGQIQTWRLVDRAIATAHDSSASNLAAKSNWPA